MAEPNSHHEIPEDPVLRRERGMRRVSSATRWTVAAAVAATAALGLTYTHLLPGTSPAKTSAQVGPQACALSSPAAGLSPTPAQVTRQRTDDDGENAADDGARNTGTVQRPAAVCPGGTAANGLAPPAQPPASAQQAPQTRTGAS